MRKMKESSTYAARYFYCVFVVWAFVSSAEEMSGHQPSLTKQQEESIRKRREEDREKYEKLLPVTIYGKVIDQDGNPVPDADVCISWERATLLIGKADYGRNDWIKTGKDGLFHFTCAKLFDASAKAKKEGYESSLGGVVVYGWHKSTSQESPAVITLRKKGETTFLLEGENYDAIRVYAPNSQTNSVNVLWNREDGKKRRHLNCDFTVAAEKASDSNQWAVTYTATEETGGMIFTNELLYVAPAEGYQRKVRLSGPPWPEYMYLRSRSPAIYSRVLLKQDALLEPDKGEGFRIIFRAWANPYGERNLEYDSRLAENWYVKDELSAEAKEAIEAKRRPLKPDITQRIRAVKERMEKERRLKQGR